MVSPVQVSQTEKNSSGQFPSFDISNRCASNLREDFFFFFFKLKTQENTVSEKTLCF